MKKVFTNAKKNARSETHNTVYQIALNSAVAVTHANNSKKICQAAFTLAEVLITLGVIGIVAAMTMPSLIANYQKKVWVNQLKKSVSLLEQGFQKMMADDGVDNLEDTSVWAYAQKAGAGNSYAEPGACWQYSYNSDDACTQFLDEWKKYFKIVDISIPKDYKTCNLNKLNCNEVSDSYYLKFADGMWVMVTVWQSEPSGRCGQLSIDINGQKLPNLSGRDIFSFNLNKNGKLDANGAAQDIIKNGWVMDY